MSPAFPQTTQSFDCSCSCSCQPEVLKGYAFNHDGQVSVPWVNSANVLNGGEKRSNSSGASMIVVNRWDEKAGLRRDAIGSQVIDVLKAQEIKETGNEEG